MPEPYGKPELRIIELKAEEVLQSGCKNPTHPGGTSSSINQGCRQVGGQGQPCWAPNAS